MAEPGSRLQPGEVVAGYEVIRVLGAGGMGTVYLARHPRLPRNQALKVLAPGLVVDPAFRQRFGREADLAAQLDHPNIVAVQDAGADGDLMWIAMQYIEGTDAAALVRKRGPLPARQAVDIIGQVAAGLDFAHGKGMLHRDVKPANMLLTSGWADGAGDRRALIADFGIARSVAEATTLTSTGAMVGTLAYAAPELLAGVTPTASVDVYALGCSLYELLTGERVYPRPDNISMMHANATATAPRVTDARPELPHALDAVLARALAKSPRDRFPTCGSLASAAASALAGDPTQARPAAHRPPEPAPEAARVPQPWGPTGPPGERTWVTPASPAVPPAQAAQAPSTPGKRRSAAVPAMLVLAVVLVAVLATVAVLYLRGSETSSTTTTGAGPTTTTGSIPSGASRTPVTRSLVGTWTGTVVGDQAGFTVSADILAVGPMSATVSYPQLGCSGRWSERSTSGAVTALVETIDVGTCVTSNIELVANADDTIGFTSTYYSTSQGRTMTITATLRRN
ncbi:serine/threonine-protein kinase [Tsukamurella pseudospumae]|uniref:non-specific serine/threonine protein kinase n=1 Tax=Tsukamurella pseudospumae TaxID=239498 RepID=A0A137ZTR5_9ACTN|nr:serine/threonine-protein kinase [Tsukamurella pseudospumae]KXP01581.1 hypothetical protein AXK61_01910 [Tsukamurella pseudospumae]